MSVTVKPERFGGLPKHRASPLGTRERAWNWLLDAVIVGAIAVLRWAPRRPAMGLGAGLGRLAGALSTSKRRRAQLNLGRAGAADPRSVCHNACRQIGRTLLEMLWLFSRTAEQARGCMHIEGLDALRQAAAEGRGVLLVSGHLANWELVPLAAAQVGLPVAVVARQMKTRRLEQRLIDFRRRCAVRTLIRGRSGAALTALRWLSRGGVLGCMMDRASGGQRMIVPFLGGSTKVPTGPAELALRSGAAVVLGAARRRDDGTTQVTFRRLLTGEATCADELARRISDEVESEIRSRPDQWFWIHRRLRHTAVAAQPAVPPATIGARFENRGGTVPERAQSLLAARPALEFGLLATLWLALLAVSLATRPLMPIDETRYASVAWEMWSNNQWLVPHLNGLPYSDKPPLMFWLIGLGWRVFGVNEWWPRVLPALFSLGSLFLTVRVCRRLWPEDREAPRLAPWVLMGSLLWAVFVTVTMFDNLVACFTLFALGAILLAERGQLRMGLLGVGLALGLGLLAKGPVIVVYVLPVGLLAPLWAASRPGRQWARWYGGLALALALGSGMALAWAIPAGIAGGEGYRGAILWRQTAGRMVEAFAHRRPWWWYLPLLAVILFPWIVWPTLWSSTRNLLRRSDAGTRFCLIWLLVPFVLLSFFSGKQPHYLLPLLPACALLAARALAGNEIRGKRRHRLGFALPLVALGVALLVGPRTGLAATLPAWVWQIAPDAAGVLIGAGLLALLVPPLRPQLEARLQALGTVFVLAALHLLVLRPAAPAYDVHGLGRFLHRAEADGRPLAHVGQYRGQYQFLGRLRVPIEAIRPAGITEWASAHPTGEVIVCLSSVDRDAAIRPAYAQPYQQQVVTVWTAASIRAGALTGLPPVEQPHE